MMDKQGGYVDGTVDESLADYLICKSDTTTTTSCEKTGGLHLEKLSLLAVGRQTGCPADKIQKF